MRPYGGRTVKRLLPFVLAAALLAIPFSAYGSVTRSPGSFTMFNPCTNEDVLITGTFHYLVYRQGDRTHTSGGTGVGLTSGTEYVYVRQGTEVSGEFSETIRLISLGSGSDLSFTDDLADTEDPVYVCS
jgi:hypothetical protein